MTDARSFGEWLRRERERRAITIRAIADRTKIGGGLLESLERGDVSRWPGGIYRRSFVRSYADAIGLDADLVLANFERLFPEVEGAPPAARGDAPQAGRGAAAPPPIHVGDEAEPPRLQLAAGPIRPGRALLNAAAVDVAIAAGFGGLGLAAAGAVGFWCAMAVAALTLHVCTLFGLKSAPFRLDRRRSLQPAPSRSLAPVVPFADEPARAVRRGRARRMISTLSAAAVPQASFRRRRAARS
jgi:transcriptional regulator with XRE-family HTH domain